MGAPSWIVWGGRLCGAETVALRPWSRAVRWGASLLETVGCDGAVPLLWEAHSARLADGLTRLGWGVPRLPGKRLLGRLLAREEITGPGVLRVLTLRHEGGVRVTAWAARYRPPRKARREGIGLHAVAVPAGPLSGIKSCSRLELAWAHEEARRAGCDAALLLDGDGAVREADHANLFAVSDGVVVTPPAPRRCLPGVMRRWCIETLACAGVAVVERDLVVSELLAADEAWLTSSLAGVVGVRSVDGTRTAGAGRVCGLLAAAGVPAPGYRPGKMAERR